MLSAKRTDYSPRGFTQCTGDENWQGSGQSNEINGLRRSPPNVGQVEQRVDGANDSFCKPLFILLFPVIHVL
jgi:hypothetical protein